MSDVIEQSGLKHRRRLIGCFGGTFNPIHHGHLRMALELKQQLALDELRLIPCHLPPHREQPDVHAQERLAMVSLAIDPCPDLCVDDRELRRQTPSYTVATLQEIRSEVGAEDSLIWCMGMDSLATFDQWFRWRDILDYAHLVVVRRPGWAPPSEGELGEWLQQHSCSDFVDATTSSSGGVFLFDCPMLDISATSIRQQVANGQSVQFLVPEAVWQYIREKQLYS